MAATTVYVPIVAGEPRREWCDQCLTSARLTVHVYALSDDGPRRIGTASGCTRCEPHLFEGR